MLFNDHMETNVTLVICVGIGCGAGWVTKYAGGPAILFGLENIAECGWSASKAIAGLMAHEIGHLLHNQIRWQKRLTSESGPWGQLYCEGFVQYCESLLPAEIRWHQVLGEDENWLNAKSSKNSIAFLILRKLHLWRMLRNMADPFWPKCQPFAANRALT